VDALKLRTIRRALWLAVIVLWILNTVAAQDAKQRPQTNSAPQLERISKQAEAARNDHRIDDAIALYKRGLAIKPSWEEGWWYLGSIYYDLDRYDDARDAFRHLTAVNPKAGPALAMLGLCEFETKKYDTALSHLGQAFTLGVPQDDQFADVARYHYAVLLTRYEHYEEAMKVLTVFAQRNLNQPDYVEAMGLAALRKPLLPSEMPPTERELVMDVGRTMYDGAGLRASQAASEFKILLAKYPSEPNIHYLYGSFLLFSDADAGLTELQKELEISPAHVPALVTIAAEYIRRHDFKAALPFAEKAAAIDPQSFAAHTMLGRVLCEGGLDDARGLKELELARQLAPASPQVRIALATAYSKVGRKDDAARERQEFLKLRKQNDESGPGLQ